MQSPVQSYSLAQYVVSVLSVSVLDGFPVAQVQDGFGRTYPPIPVANIWGSGVQPVPGEKWVIVKDNGAWTFKTRLVPVTSLLAGSVEVTVGEQPYPGQQLVMVMGPVSITTSSTGTFTAPLPSGFAFSTGYAVSAACTSSAALVVPNYGASTLSAFAGTLETGSGTAVASASAVVMVTALGA